MRRAIIATASAVAILGWTSAIGTVDAVRAPRHTGAVSLRRIWTVNISPLADSAPAFIPHTREHPHGVVYALAGNNTSNCDPGDPVRRATLFAFDAATGKRIWTRSTAGLSRCTTAGPVADPSGRWVYATGLDGRVHRYEAASGQESRGHGWPEPYTLMPDVEKASATPTISGHYLYVTTSGFIGDQGHYEGHLLTVDLRTGQTHVFNSLCSNIHRLLGPTPGASNYCSAAQSGLFGRGEGAVDPVTHDVYIVSGNGPWNGRTDWGDTLLKLSPDGARLLDAFTPQNQASLASGDLDLGSSGPALLSAVKQGGKTSHLLVQAGKGSACDSCSGAALRLLNRDNLSGLHGPGHLGGDLFDTQTPGGDEVLTAPAVWRSSSRGSYTFIANNSGVAAYRAVPAGGGRFRLDRVWQVSAGGTTPVVSGGVLYVARGGQLRALDPSTGKVLWSGGGIGGLHWQYPRVAGKRLFIGDQAGHLFAFAIGK